MTNTYKMEEKKLRKIIEKYVKPTNKEKTIDLRIYYKNRKLKNILMKNKHQSNHQKIMQEFCIPFPVMRLDVTPVI